MVGFWKSQGPLFVNGMPNPQCSPGFARRKPGRGSCIIMLPCEPGANSTTMTPACLANNTVRMALGTLHLSLRACGVLYCNPLSRHPLGL